MTPRLRGLCEDDEMQKELNQLLHGHQPCGAGFSMQQALTPARAQFLVGYHQTPNHQYSGCRKTLALPHRYRIC